MTTSASGQPKRKKPNSEESPDKSYYILSKSLDTCGKCNKKCTSKGDAIQCDLCGTWVHAACEGITHEKYKAIKSLALDNIVYYCQINNCLSRTKHIINEYIKHQAQITTKLETMVSNISQQNLTTEYDNLQKAVANLSTRIDNLTARESELSNQIKDTSKALEKQPAAPSTQPSFNRKLNVVVFGVEESPPKTFKSVRLQKDMESVSEIFASISVQVNPSQILDCYRLGNSSLHRLDLDLFWLNSYDQLMLLPSLLTGGHCQVPFLLSQTCPLRSALQNQPCLGSGGL